MANPIDKLIIQIEADTKQLKKELKQIEGKIKTTGAAGGAAFGGMAGGLSKVKAGAIASVAAFATMGVALGKVAQIGSQFEDLKDSLDQVFGSMEAGDAAMKRVFDFAQKTPFQIETATKAFISLKSAGIEPNDRMLQTFADTASTSVDQLGVFEALIRTVQRSASGGLGLEELNMVMDRGIDVLGILNKELGLSKDEIAKFGATAEGAKLITDALVNGLERQFGGAMAAKMDNLSTKTSNMTIAFKQLADDLFKTGLGDFLGRMADRLTQMANAITAASAASRGEGVGITMGTDPMENIRRLEAEKARVSKNIIAAQIDPNTGQVMADAKFPEQAAKMIDVFKEELKVIQNINAELDKQADILFDEDLFQTAKEKKEIDKQDLMRKGELRNAYTFLANEIVKLKGNEDELAFASKNLGEIFKENELAFAQMGITTLPQLEVAMSKIKDSSVDLENTMSDALAQILENASDTFANDFINSLQEGENALVSFRNLVGDMIQQVIAEFLKMQVIKPLMNALFTAVGLPTLPAKAGGGTIQGGRATLVGERGPEIFVPNTGGTIMNNMNSKNAMGGGTPINIYQNLNFATGVVPTVRAEVTKMMPQIADVTKAAVQESAMRGGTFRRSLVGG